MTTTTHTISIQENIHVGNGTVSAKRVSKTRTYRACIVATATQKTVSDIALKLAAHEKQVAELTPAVLSALKANGYETEAAFEAAHLAAVQAWWQPRTEERKKISDAVEAAEGKRFHFLNAAETIRADAATEARGFVNPDGGIMGTLKKLVWELSKDRSSVAQIKKQNVQVGDQVVVTWARDAGLAQKALKSRDCKHYSDRGYTLAVRTDITVVSK